MRIHSDVAIALERRRRREREQLRDAAPELLAALKAVIDRACTDHKMQAEFGGFVLDDDLIEQVDAAIAKAEGRPGSQIDEVV